MLVTSSSYHVIKSHQRESELKDQLKTISHDLLALLTTLGGKGYSIETIPTDLLQLLKSLITQQQEKILVQDQNVGCHGEHVFGVYLFI